MYDKHYLNYYDDSEIAESVALIKENVSSARSFAEIIYIPTFVHEQNIFFGCLAAQREGLIYDIFRRCYEIYGEECTFDREQFSAEEWSYGESVNAIILNLPKVQLEMGNLLQIWMLIDDNTDDFFYVTVEDGDDGDKKVYVMNFHDEDPTWDGGYDAPDDFDGLFEFIIKLTVRKGVSDYQFVKKTCPLCKHTFHLGLSEEEMEGYRRFLEDDEDLEDAIPKLNAFEREFLITGMCPDCQCRVFKKELPSDISRWRVE